MPTTSFLTLSAVGSHIVGNDGGNRNRHFWNVETGEKVKGVLSSCGFIVLASMSWCGKPLELLYRHFLH